jgi:hypothetical protein
VIFVAYEKIALDSESRFSRNIQRYRLSAESHGCPVLPGSALDTAAAGSKPSAPGFFSKICVQITHHGGGIAQQNS